MATRSEKLLAALDHVKLHDPVMADVMHRVGPFGLRPQRDYFRMLVSSIISQQISGKAAKSIQAKLEALFAPRPLSAAELLTYSPEKLRTAGISPQKAAYLLDLADKVASGVVHLPRIAKLPDDEIVAELIQVKGIGEWTAQMFLIFALGRLDVFPHADLGVRMALKNLHGLDELPNKQLSHTLATPWRPYATIGTWYCWKSLDLK